MLPSSDSSPTTGRAGARAAQVVVVTSVMFTFISYWRTAAVVLCDMASTAYYIGGDRRERDRQGRAVVHPGGDACSATSCGPSTSKAARCSSAAASTGSSRKRWADWCAKPAVSALLFDYILTGPISGVSAGQYIIGLARDRSPTQPASNSTRRRATRSRRWGSVAIAVAITLYFFRQNLLGIHESSDKALKIMIATTIMAVVMLGWCVTTLAIRGPVNPMPSWRPTSTEKVETSPTARPCRGSTRSPASKKTRWACSANSRQLAEPLRQPTSWLSLIGAIGIVIAFGHSILAMSGEETLAQVYREVESPKLQNFKKAGFIVFVYSLLLTGTISFLCVMLIPDDDRITPLLRQPDRRPGDARGRPARVRLLLNAFVVVVGFLILSGAVNTAIVGSNGVLNRVAEDGVLPDWFLKPHPRLGTTYRLLYLIAGLQLLTIVVSRGDVICWARPMPSASSGASCSRRCRCSCCGSRSAAPRVHGAAEHPRRQSLRADRPELRVPDRACRGAGEPRHEADRHGRRPGLRRRLPDHLHRHRNSTNAAAAAQQHEHLEQFNRETVRAASRARASG